MIATKIKVVCTVRVQKEIDSSRRAPRNAVTGAVNRLVMPTGLHAADAMPKRVNSIVMVG